MARCTLRQKGCNGVAWVYDQLGGEKCNSVGWMYDRLPPIQSRIDALNTTTPNLPDVYIENNAYIHMADKLPLQTYLPLSIEYRCLEYCYTKLAIYRERTMHISP